MNNINASILRVSALHHATADGAVRASIPRHEAESRGQKVTRLEAGPDVPIPAFCPSPLWRLGCSTYQPASARIIRSFMKLPASFRCAAWPCACIIMMSREPRQTTRGLPGTSFAKKGGDPECMLRGLRGRRVQGPVPSGPARGGPARAQLGWGAFRTARGL